MLRLFASLVRWGWSPFLLLLLGWALFLILMLFPLFHGCERRNLIEEGRPAQAQHVPSAESGLGMTYSGKVGVKMALGLVMTFDGEVAPGFGF